MATVNGFSTGYTSAVNTYNARDHIAEIEYDFTTYDSRLARYWHNRRYADNTIYHAVNAYADLYKWKESLYKGVRGLRNPIGRLNQIEAAKIFGGIINYETFDTGAITITGADDVLLEAIGTTLQWSNADTMKTMYVREGSKMGDIALKIVDDVDRQKVRIEVLDPRKVYDVQFDAIGNVKSIDIRYDRFDFDLNIWYTYRETIDREVFRTYRDGKPFAFTSDGNGQGVEEWVNPYGFVPVEWTPHVATGLGFGVTSFHHVRHKIDNLNDLSTLIHDNVRKVVNTKYAVKGTKPELNTSSLPSTVTVTDDNRDKSPMIYMGKDGEISPIAFPLDITGALEAAMDQQREIESDLPQLALQRMRENNASLSGVAIENMYSDAVDIISELHGNYSNGLKQSLQMAISIGAFRRYDGFQSYNLDSFQSGALDFQIKPRVLFRDELRTKERIELTNMALGSNSPALLLGLLDFDAETIDTVTDTMATATATVATATARANRRSSAESTRRQANENATSTTSALPETIPVIEEPEIVGAR